MLLQKVNNFIVKNPKTVIVICVFLTLFFLVGIGKLDTRTDIAADLPQNDPYILTNQRVESIFGKKDTVTIMVSNSDGIYNLKTLNKIYHILSDLKEVEGVIPGEVKSIYSINSITRIQEQLDIGPLLENVPTSLKQVEQLKRKVLNDELILGKIISKDEKSTLIIANLERGYDIKKVYHQVKEIEDKYRHPERVEALDEIIMNQVITGGIQKDINLLFPLALLFVLVGFFISFRTLRGIFLPFIVIVLSVLWTLGLMGFVGVPLSVISSVIPVFLVAIASSYGVHVMHRYYEGISKAQRKEEVIYDILARLSPTIIITGITSALGLSTLMVFKVLSIKEFGIFSALGVFFACLISITLVPAILLLLKNPVLDARGMKKKINRLGGFLGRVTVFSIRFRFYVLLIVSLIILASLIGISRLKIGEDTLEFFPKKHSFLGTISLFNNKFNGAGNFNLMFEFPNPGDIKKPANMKKVLDFQDYARSLNEVGEVDSIVDVIMRMNKVFHKDDVSYYKLPDSQKLIAQYLLLYSLASDPGDFESMIDPDFRRLRILMRINTFDNEKHIELYNKLKSFVVSSHYADVKLEFGGMLMFGIAQTHYVVIGKILSIIISILVVFIICCFWFHSLRCGIFSIIPLSISTILTFGIMGFLGIRLNLATAIITSVAVGVGVDFAIHYIARIKEEAEKQGSSLMDVLVLTGGSGGKAIVFDAESNVLGFAIFIFSAFAPISDFGWLVSLTMLTSCFGTLILLPVLFYVFKASIFKEKR